MSVDHDKSPLFIPGEGPGVLCLHGLTGTPFELAPLARALAAAGFSVSVPLLAGHGDTVATLAKTRWQDWLDSAESAFERLREQTGGAPVTVVGFSMGGLLTLRMASQRSGMMSALVLLSVPLRLAAWQSAAVRAFGYLPGPLRRSRFAAIAKPNGSDVTDPQVRAENPTLPKIPLAGVVELLKLAELARGHLGDIRLPVFVAHGERDQAVPIASSFELAGSLGSNVVERLWLPRSGHLIAVDVERVALGEAVVRFLSNLREPRKPEHKDGSTT